jgi:hypothetical protein
MLALDEYWVCLAGYTSPNVHTWTWTLLRHDPNSMIDSGEFPRLDARGHVVARAFSGASSRVTVTPLFPSKALTREGITIILSFTYASLISTLAFVPGYKRTYGFTLKATKPCPRSSAPGVDTSPPTISSCQSLPCRIYCVDTMLPCHQRHK